MGELSDNVNSAVELMDDLGDKGLRLLDKKTQPDFLFKAAFATSAGAVLGGAVVNAAQQGLSGLVSLLTTDWDELGAAVYLENLNSIFKLYERLESLEKKLFKAVEAQALIEDYKKKIHLVSELIMRILPPIFLVTPMEIFGMRKYLIN